MDVRNTLQKMTNMEYSCQKIRHSSTDAF